MSYQERYTAYQEAIETYLNTIFLRRTSPMESSRSPFAIAFWPGASGSALC